MKLKDLPPSLRKFAFHSNAVSLRGIERALGIPHHAVRQIRNGLLRPTESQVRLLAAYFNITPDKFEKALPLIAEWSKLKTLGRLPETV